MAPPSATKRSTNSHAIPPTTRRPQKLNFEIGPTSPAVAMPPGKPNDSASVTFAPFRAAATAATNPAGPAPAMNTSDRSVRRAAGRAAVAQPPAEAARTAPKKPRRPRVISHYLITITAPPGALRA